MAIDLDLGVSGLWTNANAIAGAPPGAMTVADDVVFRRPRTMEPRPGMPVFGGGRFGANTAGGDLARRAVWFQGHAAAKQMVVHYAADKLAHSADGVTWTDYAGTYPYPATNYRPPLVEANGELYVNTSAGAYSLDDVTGAWVPAGVPRALDFTATLAETSGNVMPANSQAAYRMVWGIINANGRLKRSAISQRVVISGLSAPVPVAIGGMVRATNVTTVTSTSHGYATGAVLYHTSGDFNFLEGTTAAITVTDANHFTYPDVAANATSTAAATFHYATRNVTLAGNIPAGITTSHFLEVYRTPFTARADVDPGDREQKVMEFRPTNVDITAKRFTATDDTPDVVLQDLIYFQNNEGDKDLPPVARCAVYFKGSEVYGCTQGPQRLGLSLIAVPASPAIISIADAGTAATLLWLQAGSVEDASIGEYKYFTDGTVGQNIANTALSIVRVLNSWASNTYFNAYYLSAESDAPGRIEFVARSDSMSPFSVYVISAPGTQFVPVLPELQNIAVLSRTANVVTTEITTTAGLQVGQRVTLALPIAAGTFTAGVKIVTAITGPTYFTYTEAGINETVTPSLANITTVPLTTVTSTNDFTGNRILWSAFEEPDAVPPANYQDLASAGAQVQALAVMRDSLFIWLNEGLWRGNGHNEDFAFSQVDPTIKLIAPETVKVLNNVMYGLTDKGVVAITEAGGKEYVSQPIDDQLPRLPSTDLTAYAFAVANEATQEYILFATFDGTPRSTVPTRAHVFNAQTRQWSRWILPMTAGTSDGSYLYLAGAQTLPSAGGTAYNIVTRDVRNTTAWMNQYDWMSTSLDVVPGPAANQLTFTAPATYLAVGNTITTDNGITGVITAAASLGTTPVITLSSADTTGAGTVTVYGQVPSAWTWLPQLAGNPGRLKMWSRPAALFRSAAFYDARMGFATEFEPTTEYCDNLLGTSELQAAGVEAPIAGTVPMTKSYGARMNVSMGVSNGLAVWELEGLRINARPLKEAMRR